MEFSSGGRFKLLEELAYWICKEMKNNKKHAKYIIPWLLVSVIAKME